jgi:hypothetical protein
MNSENDKKLPPGTIGFLDQGEDTYMKDVSFEGFDNAIVAQGERLKVDDVEAKTTPGLSMQVERDEKSFGYFNIAYGILLAIAIGVISVLYLDSEHKVLLIIGSALVLFWLCYWNGWFRNKIVGIFSKIQDLVEKYHG